MLRVTAAIGVTAALALGAGASQSGAATSMDIAVTALIGTNANGVQEVTHGDKIGLKLDVTVPSSSSTVTHSVVTVDGGGATYSDDNSDACVPSSGGTKMVCTFGQLSSSTTVEVFFRFTAPTTGAAVTISATGTIAAQTNGGPNSGTSTFPGTPATISLTDTEGASIRKSFLRPTEALTTGATLPQHSSFTMPNAFLTSAYGLETSVEEVDDATPRCSKCPFYATDLSIPASTNAATNPFSAAKPFSFEITLEGWARPNGYQVTGLYHDGNPIPQCSASPLSATTDICLTEPISEARPSKTLTAKGIAKKNGRIGFG